ncbi:hypothetical protein QVD17_41222 [Tagetes erecta]|uniref:Uncharacterized protein n=1 Tax=Tagetes erecta TaxID=13708 RepID=A0AAD8JQQ1_TARER|nr:hypothetical protein QVD17_41222 [Tagetes erecta]
MSAQMSDSDDEIIMRRLPNCGDVDNSPFFSKMYEAEDPWERAIQMRINFEPCFITLAKNNTDTLEIPAEFAMEHMNDVPSIMELPIEGYKGDVHMVKYSKNCHTLSGEGFISLMRSLDAEPVDVLIFYITKTNPLMFKVMVVRSNKADYLNLK